MSEEREMLRDTVASIVEKHASPEAVRRAMDSERGYDEALWTLLCEQVGAAALVVPEELGGAGGELADAAVVIEMLGRALVPTPLLGTTLAELNSALEKLGLTLHNMGDIDEQTVAGAISTGTHGTGGRRSSLSAQVSGLELVTGKGELMQVDAQQHPGVLDVARLGLGALGRHAA